MEITKKKRKIIVITTAIFFGLIMTLLGGAKLMFYILLLFTGAFVGYHVKSIIIVIRDYRLSLKINTVLFNSKESEKMKDTINQLRAELQSAETRLNLTKGD